MKLMIGVVGDAQLAVDQLDLLGHRVRSPVLV
jgi:hypothetical protein